MLAMRRRAIEKSARDAQARLKLGVQEPVNPLEMWARCNTDI
jgi:hypothetical protein